MKRIKILGIIMLFVGLVGCEQEDDVVFVAGSSEISFTNTFLNEYVLSPATSGNIGERFTWNTPDTGVPTNYTFTLQKSNSGDFSDAENVASTSSNEIAITIGDMLGYAAQIGLDAIPDNGIPNTGQVSFRVRAEIGEGGDFTYSASQALTLVMLEETDEPVASCEFDQLFGVGAGLPTAGWSWDTPVVVPCTGTSVYTANVYFTAEGDANFRFFTTETDWGSGRNYPWYVNEGYTIDSNFEDAMDGDNNFRFIGTSGQYFLTIDDLNKVISLEPAMATGTCEFDLLYGVGAGLPEAGWDWATPVELWCQSDGVYVAYAQLQNNGGADNNFRFFTVATDWGSGRNYPWYINEGYTIDPLFEDAMDGDNNFAFNGTTGSYLITINDNDKTITVQ